MPLIQTKVRRNTSGTTQLLIAISGYLFQLFSCINQAIWIAKFLISLLSSQTGDLQPLLNGSQIT